MVDGIRRWWRRWRQDGTPTEVRESQAERVYYTYRQRAEKLNYLHQVSKHNQQVALWESASICASCASASITQTKRQNEPRVVCEELHRVVEHDMVRCNRYTAKGAQSFRELLDDWQGVMIGDGEHDRETT